MTNWTCIPALAAPAPLAALGASSWLRRERPGLRTTRAAGPSGPGAVATR